jgi:hypothetical protein
LEPDIGSYFFTLVPKLCFQNMTRQVSRRILDRRRTKPRKFAHRCIGRRKNIHSCKRTDFPRCGGLALYARAPANSTDTAVKSPADVFKSIVGRWDDAIAALVNPMHFSRIMSKWQERHHAKLYQVRRWPLFLPCICQDNVKVVGDTSCKTLPGTSSAVGMTVAPLLVPPRAFAGIMSKRQARHHAELMASKRRGLTVLLALPPCTLAQGVELVGRVWATIFTCVGPVFRPCCHSVWLHLAEKQSDLFCKFMEL